MIAICLVTCDRFDYTRETLQTLAAFNVLAQFALLHGDDASEDPRILPMVERAGFETVRSTPQRVGITEMVRQLVGVAHRRGYEWVWLLENDWASAREFPHALFDFVAGRQDVYCLRLYGQFKERWQQRPCGGHHRGRAGKSAGWVPLVGAPEPAEIGDIHWGNPPAVTRTDILLPLLKDAQTESAVMRASGAVQEHVVRVVENVLFHVGAARTPAFRR